MKLGTNVKKSRQELAAPAAFQVAPASPRRRAAAQPASVSHSARGPDTPHWAHARRSCRKEPRWTELRQDWAAGGLKGHGCRINSQKRPRPPRPALCQGGLGRGGPCWVPQDLAGGVGTGPGHCCSCRRHPKCLLLQEAFCLSTALQSPLQPSNTRGHCSWDLVSRDTGWLPRRALLPHSPFIVQAGPAGLHQPKSSAGKWNGIQAPPCLQHREGNGPERGPGSAPTSGQAPRLVPSCPPSRNPSLRARGKGPLLCCQEAAVWGQFPTHP